MKNNDHIHAPVLLQSVINLLAPKPGEKYLDLTAGYGGHARRIIDAIGDAELATLVDRDQFAIDHLHEFDEAGARLIHESFSSAVKKLVEDEERYDMILMDLGVSSPQLDNPERGFSFQHDAPLDMRMDYDADKTAAEVINFSTFEELSLILRDLGGETRYSKIAKFIVDHRPVSTTTELAKLVEDAVGGRKATDKIHPATRTFQALRIAVNNEIKELEYALPRLFKLLNPGGRLAIISFHSLEDGKVKHFFKEKSYGLDAEFELLTKKPMLGATEELSNPRARSAKLRAVLKK